MNPSQLSERLNLRAEQVCQELLPNGKRQGHEWVAGNIHGTAGDSLKICLSGSKIGVWADFATNLRGGDLLDLWVATRGIDLRQAMNEAACWLGIPSDSRDSRPKKTFRFPDRPKEIRNVNPTGAVMDYLQSRGINEQTIRAYRICEQPGNLRFPNLADNTGTIIFPYLRDGKLLNCKYLALARPNGKKQMMQEGGCEPCLFGWQALSPTTRAVTIVEGEIDALTLYQFGIPSLSVPMGGGGGAKQDWIESEFDYLERFDVIYIAMDNDAAGKEATKEIVKRLGEERCRLVEWPEPYKDANECLIKGKFTQKDFARCITGARTLDPEELKPASAYLSAVLHEFYPSPDTPRGLATPWEKVGDRLRFRPGELTIWTGWSGHGKSLVLNHIVASGLQREEKFCIASMEMLPSRTMKRLIKQLTGLESPTTGYIAHCSEQIAAKLWLFDLLGTAKTDRMLDVFAYAVRRYQIGQFVVDSLAKCGLAEDDYNGQKLFVERLVDFVHQHSVHIHLVSHARKGADERTPPGKMDVKGTGALTDLADNVITVWRNKPKEEQRARVEAEGHPFDEENSEKPDAALVVSKQRHGGWEGEIWLWFDPASQQYLARCGDSPKRYIDYVGC